MVEKKNTTEKNPFGIPGSSILLKSQDPMKKNKHLRIFYFGRKKDIREFLNFEKKNNYESLVLIEKEFLSSNIQKNEYFLSFLIFKKLMNSKYISALNIYRLS